MMLEFLKKDALDDVSVSINNEFINQYISSEELVIASNWKNPNRFFKKGVVFVVCPSCKHPVNVRHYTNNKIYKSIKETPDRVLANVGVFSCSKCEKQFILRKQFRMMEVKL